MSVRRRTFLPKDLRLSGCIGSMAFVFSAPFAALVSCICLPFAASVPASEAAEDAIPNQSKGTHAAPLTVEKPDYSGYELVWHDEFERDGDPDPVLWNNEEGFVRNHEAQWYQRKNAVCRGGMLVIEGREETVKNPHYVEGSKDWRKARREARYTSASLTTQGKRAWKYGRFEIRARFAPREGMWPAFWTMGVDEGWPACGEIDIMEYYQSLYLANLCWSSPKPGIGHWSTTRTPLSRFKALDAEWAGKFHVFRMDWDEKEVKLYADDILLNRTSISHTVNDRFQKIANPFHQPHYIILNLALGATGGSLDHLPLPRKFEVDYVRVYQKRAKR